MTKIVDPHMTLPLNSPLVCVERIEIHDTFVITYRDTITQGSGKKSGELFLGHDILEPAIFK
jgi:hypothetical protein